MRAGASARGYDIVLCGVGFLGLFLSQRGLRLSSSNKAGTHTLFLTIGAGIYFGESVN